MAKTFNKNQYISQSWSFVFFHALNSKITLIVGYFSVTLKCKLLLDSLYEKKAKGYKVHSRAAWVELGEKSTKYFSGLDKSRETNNVIHSLNDKTGSEKVEDQDIL